MQYASQAGLSTKRDYADLLMLSLAAMALRAGERVGILNDVGQPPSTTPAGLDRLASLLDQGHYDTDAAPPLQMVKRHSTAVLCSDFLGSLDSLTATLRHLVALQVHGVLVQVLDPAEIELPFTGRVRFEGLEGETPELAPRVESITDDYKTRLAERGRTLELIAIQAGWHIVPVRTDHAPYATLVELHRLLGGRNQ
jgi:uncharacterized protein (DUF58 family)